MCCVMPALSVMDSNGAASGTICERLFSPVCSAHWVGPCSVFSVRSGSLSIMCEHGIARIGGGKDGDLSLTLLVTSPHLPLGADD